MALVSVNDLQPGMMLDRDAVLSNGRILLRSGAVLEEKHIRIFKSWGLVGAEVEGVTQEQLDHEALHDLDPAVLEAARENITALFRHTDLTHPMISELHRLLVRQQTRRMEGSNSREVDG